ncbi:MAG TPA: 3'(2'),5'-bisphosphate nucleotidase CysQ [Candidatus Dormibacteraeota bacterium]|jgi:3'(2'), 5'-bisphosphate nucleotidase
MTVTLLPGRTTRSQDHDDAERLARDAGSLLTAIRHITTGRDLGALGDRCSQVLLAAEIGRRHPDDAVLSEEGVDDPGRLTARRVWIIDPLDGTREFGEPGRVDWAVHVALWEEGEIAAAAVALPGRGLVLSTSQPPSRRAAEAGTPVRILVSRTRPPDVATRVAEHLGARLVPMGSAGAKIAAVVLGEADAYLHAGGQYEWDSAAPVGVALAAGFHASRVDGTPLRYNRPDPSLPDLLVCRPELSEVLLDAVRAVS